MTEFWWIFFQKENGNACKTFTKRLKLLLRNVPRQNLSHKKWSQQSFSVSEPNKWTPVSTSECQAFSSSICQQCLQLRVHSYKLRNKYSQKGSVYLFCLHIFTYNVHIPLNIFVSYEFLILSPSLRMKLVDEAPKQQQAAAPAVRFNGVNNGNGQQVQKKRKGK